MRRQSTKQQLWAGPLTWLSRHFCTAKETEQCKRASFLSGQLLMPSVTAGLVPYCLPSCCSASGVCAGLTGKQQTSQKPQVKDKLYCKGLSCKPNGMES